MIKTMAVLASTAVLAAASLGVHSAVAATTSTSKAPIPIAWTISQTGPFAPYGQPSTLAAKLAVNDINDHGGVLGRPLKLVEYDSQSSGATAVANAHKIGSSDAAAVFGTLFESTTIATRPIYQRAGKLYFRTQNSGGGWCSKLFFNGGTVGYQQIKPLLKYMVDEKHLTKWYVIAADYAYGRSSAAWAVHFAKLYGAKLVAKPDFVALGDSDFSNTISKIQASGADFIYTVLVGGPELNFYKQWAASGLNKTTIIASTSYGEGAEEITLGEAGKGIYADYSYLPTAAFPEPGNKLAALWKQSGTKLPMESASPVTTWDTLHLWAMAVNKAGSLDNAKVIHELETGHIVFDGPTGKVWFDPPTHQIVVPMILYRDNGEGSFDKIKVLTEAAEPEYLQSKCNLIKHPDADARIVFEGDK